MLSIVGTTITVEEIIEHIEQLGYECVLGKNHRDIVLQYNLMIEDDIFYKTLDFSKKIGETEAIVSVLFNNKNITKYYSLNSKVRIHSIEYSIIEKQPTHEPDFDDIPF